MSFWSDKKVLVAGGAGFIGSHTVEMLIKKGAKVSVADNLQNSTLDNLIAVKDKYEFKKADLMDMAEAKQVCSDQDIVMNLAARVAGIEFNRLHSGTMFKDNAVMNMNLLEAARLCHVERFLVVSSACVYPSDSVIPIPESAGFNGEPELTNYGYGWAKRVAEVQAKAYTMEFDMKISIARPFNTYGPRDHFDPKISHVIPALIRRVFEGEDPLNVWGDGRQTRAFLYVSDLARGLIDTIEKYPECDPINIGTDEEVSIKNLVLSIVSLSGKDPRIVFDDSKPAGQPRRSCDTGKAKKMVGFEAKTMLEDGLRHTIEWYRKTLSDQT